MTHIREKRKEKVLQKMDPATRERWTTGKNSNEKKKRIECEAKEKENDRNSKLRYLLPSVETRVCELPV